MNRFCWLSLVALSACGSSDHNSITAPSDAAAPSDGGSPTDSAQGPREAGPASAPGPCPAALPAGITSGVQTTYYVAYDTGDDTKDGTTKDTAWKHAPGDPQAVSVPASVALKPGTMILFKGGVVYRGYINVPASGAQGSPIIYEGTGWSNNGSSQAILSGQDIETINFSSSTYPGLTSATLGGTVPTVLGMVLTIDGKRYFWSQTPQPVNNYWYENNPGQASVDLAGSGNAWTWTDVGPVAALKAIEPSTIPHVIARVHGDPNIIYEMSVTGLSGNTISLSCSGTTCFRPEGKPTYHLVNNPVWVSGPEFALEGNILYAPVAAGQHTVEIANSDAPFAINVKNHDYITVDGFDIGYYAGAAVGESNFAASKIAATNNHIHDMVSLSGSRMIGFAGGSGYYIANNKIENIAFIGGVGLAQTQDSTVTCNTMDTLGNTGIDSYSNLNLTASYNIISNILATEAAQHGDCIAIYDTAGSSQRTYNEQITISNNQCANTGTSITSNGGDHVTVSGNVVIATAAGYVPWSTGGVWDIFGNIFLVNDSNNWIGLWLISNATGPVGGPGTNSDKISVHDNISDGITAGAPGHPPDSTWTISNNVLTNQYSSSYNLIPPGATLDTSLRPTVVSALVSPGQLPASICSILKVHGPVGVEYSCP